MILGGFPLRRVSCLHFRFEGKKGEEKITSTNKVFVSKIERPNINLLLDNLSELSLPDTFLPSAASHIFIKFAVPFAVNLPMLLLFFSSFSRRPPWSGRNIFINFIFRLRNLWMGTLFAVPLASGESNSEGLEESVENRFMIIKAQLDQVLVGKRKVTERQGFDPKMQQMDGEKLLHYLWTVKCLRRKFPVS